jgi:hypothetical protein
LFCSRGTYTFLNSQHCKIPHKHCNTGNTLICSHHTPACPCCCVLPLLLQPCLGKCSQCNPAADTCCPGYSCQQSGRYGRFYCVPDCVPYKPQCAGAGGFCGLTAGGVKCCKGLDCIVAEGGVSICAPHDSCKPRGSVCKGFGECGSGLFCAPNKKCELAACRSKGKYQRSASAQAQKNAQDYQCTAFYSASHSAP